VTVQRGKARIGPGGLLSHPSSTVCTAPYRTTRSWQVMSQQPSTVTFSVIYENAHSLSKMCGVFFASDHQVTSLRIANWVS